MTTPTPPISVSAVEGALTRDIAAHVVPPLITEQERDRLKAEVEEAYKAFFERIEATAKRVRVVITRLASQPPNARR